MYSTVQKVRLQDAFTLGSLLLSQHDLRVEKLYCIDTIKCSLVVRIFGLPGSAIHRPTVPWFHIQK